MTAKGTLLQSVVTPLTASLGVLVTASAHRVAHFRVGNPVRPALPLLVCLLLAACGPGASEQPLISAAIGGGSSTTSTSTPTTTATEPLDPGAVLADAHRATAGNYRFRSVVVVDGATIITISGVVDGASVAATLETGTSIIDYVRTPAGEWVTGPEGEMVPLEGEPPTGAPLDLLEDATEASIDHQDSDATALTATLGAPAGPSAGLRVSITVSGAVVTEISYRAEAEGVVADVTTTVSDVGRAGTVEAPAAG